MTGAGERAPDAPAVESGVYPTDLQECAQWLTWKPTDDGRKVPRAPYEHQDQPNCYASAQDPDKWTKFDEAQAWAERLPGHDLAFTTPTDEVNEGNDEDDDGVGEPHVLIEIQKTYQDISAGDPLVVLMMALIIGRLLEW